MSSVILPKVFLIILNWNGWSDTVRCLNSLRDLSFIPSTKLRTGNYQLSILVVDNGSTDGSAERLMAYSLLASLRASRSGQPTAPRFELIQNAENLGFAGGNNVGIKYALEQGADYICLLNNDTLVEPDFLEKLIAVGEQHKDIGMLNPKILLLDDAAKSRKNADYTQTDADIQGQRKSAFSLRKSAPRFWWIGGKINWLHTRGWHPYYTEEDRGQFDRNEFFETDYCTGCCVLMKREVIEKIGLMPEEYFLYYEDADWSLRTRKAGFQCVVVPSAAIWHEGAAANKEGSPKYIRYHVRNGLMLALRTGNIVQILCAYFMTIPRAKWQVIKWLIIPSKRSWAKAIMLGIWDAWMGRMGKIKN